MLILLVDTRRKLLWWWLGATIAIVLLVFMQTLAGKFEEIETKAWVWLVVQLLPTLLLLFIAVISNRNPSKVLRRTTFQALHRTEIAYVLLVFITLIALPMATRNRSIEDYLQLSYCWLLPFQLVLLLLLGFLFFQKDAFFQPNAAIMEEYVGKKAEYARRNGKLLQVQGFGELIQTDGVEKVLNWFNRQLQPKSNELIVLQGQYVNWKNSRDLNLVAPDVLQRELNRITIETIHLIENV